MAKFMTSLRLERVDDISHDGRGTWQLLTPLAYISDVGKQTIVAQEGFLTDLASVPRLPIAFFLAGGTAHAAAVIHDWLYTTHETTKSLADEILYEACLVCGVPKWRAWIILMGVRIGGQASWDRDVPEKMAETPLVEGLDEAPDESLHS